MLQRIILHRNLECYAHESRKIQFSLVQLFSRVRLFATPWTAACQALLSITNSWSLLKLMSIELMMPSNHLTLCHPLLLLLSIFPNHRVFSKESVLRIRWPKYWGFNFSISPSNEQSGLISFRIDWLISLQSKGLLRVFSNMVMVKQKMVRINIDILGISKLKWMGMSGFNSEGHYICYHRQEFHRRNGVALIINKSLKYSTWVQPQK